MNVATLICVYGRDDPVLFERALVSIFEQKDIDGITHAVFLGVDGPISEQLECVVDKFRSKIFKIVRNGRSLGLAKALNILINDVLEFDFVFRMDADDFSYPYRYRRQLDFMASNPEVDVLGAAIREVSDKGSNIVFFPLTPVEASNKIYYRVPLAHPTACIRNSVFKSYRYPDSFCNEDLALWINLDKENYKFSNLPEVLLDFTVSQSFWSRRSVKKSVGEFILFWSVFQYKDVFIANRLLPVLRFILRISPSFISKFVYNSGFLRGR